MPYSAKQRWQASLQREMEFYSARDHDALQELVTDLHDLRFKDIPLAPDLDDEPGPTRYLAEYEHNRTPDLDANIRMTMPHAAAREFEMWGYRAA